MEHELALLREELRIKDARMERVPPLRRPHYPAVERLALLELRAIRGWSAAQTAERFFVTEATVPSWVVRLDEHGSSALVRTPAPVNRFPDFVAYIVQRLQVLCPPSGTARWPLCRWVAVGVDHFSRRIMGVRAFRIRPKAIAVSAFLASMIRAAGQSPRRLITDRGREFTAKSIRRGCRRSGIRPRFGAIGKHGRIALVERCIRTLHDEGVRRWLAPTRWRTVGRELSLFADWYNGQRPHAELAGAAPDEIYFGRQPAHHRPRFEPRPRWPLSFATIESAHC